MIIAGRQLFFADIILLKRWLFGCLLFFIAACTGTTGSYNRLSVSAGDSARMEAIQNRAFVKIAAVKKLIQTGDLITRTGNDFTSESLRQFNQHDQTYSHCGIASIEHDSVFVYHALGGDFNPDQKIRRDPLELFCEPYSNRGMGIFRFKLDTSTVHKVMATAEKFYQSGVMFDMQFDLATDQRMYCAEFVYKSFVAGSNHKLYFNISHLKSFNFIGVDDLFKNPGCVEIERIVYK